MLDIKRIKVDGYKNVSNANIELSKITSFLSINSYGKSNLLQAIDFGFEFLSYTPKEKSFLMNWNNGMSLLENTVGKNFKFEIEFLVSNENFENDVVYGYEFRWGIDEKKTPKIITEYLKIKNSLESQKYTTYIDRTEEKSLYRSTEKGRCDKEISVEVNELLINKLNAYDNLSYLQIIKILNDFNVYIDRHFDSKNHYKIMPFKLKGINPISLYDEGIARKLHNIKKEHPEKFDLIKNILMDLFPFIEDLYIREINLTQTKINAPLIVDEGRELLDYEYVLSAKHKNLIKPILFSEMSDGVRRVLLLLTYIVIAELNNVHLIAIEEPENSIHLGLLRSYLMILDSITERAKIIITSHSPFLINCIDLSTLYLGVPNNNCEAMFRKIKKTTINKIISEADDRDMLTGEYLFDLMSGSDDDLAELEKYLENE